MTLNLATSTHPLYRDGRGNIIYIESSEVSIDEDEEGNSIETEEVYVGYSVDIDTAKRIMGRTPQRLHWLDAYTALNYEFNEDGTADTDIRDIKFNLVSVWVPEPILEVDNDYFC